MPFTFSHPALILPLTKLPTKYISATGLVIGSMSPDFEYFIKMRMEKVIGHSTAGLFYFDLPLTILLAFLFHLFVRDSLIRNLPDFLSAPFQHLIGLDWIKWVQKRWYVLIYSAFIGIFSHIIWDAFTHTNGYFVERIPFLQGSTSVFGVIISKPDLAQVLSTLLGAAALLLAIIWPQQKAFNPDQFMRKVSYWILVCLIMFITLLLRNGQDFGDFVATSIAGGLLGLLFAPVLLKMWFGAAASPK